MASWFNCPQIWATTACTTTTYANTISQETEYIDYDHLYYNGLFSSSVSTAEANGPFDCFYPVEITTPIKKHGVKMG